MTGEDLNEQLASAQEDPFVRIAIAQMLGELSDIVRAHDGNPFEWPDDLHVAAASVCALTGVDDVEAVARWLSDIAGDFAQEPPTAPFH